jgi:hypothetical protein
VRRQLTGGGRLSRGGAPDYQRDLINSDRVVIMGSNMPEAHLIGFQWVMEAKARCAKVFHVDPRFTRTSAPAHRHVPLRPGSDIAFLGAVITARYAGRHQDEERAVGAQGKAKVLSIGLHPSTVDFTPYPGQDASTLMARIRAGAEALRANGFDPVLCLVPTDPAEAEAVVRECLAEGPFRAVLVGAGVRTAPEHTVLFERLVNLAHEALPDARFCFNTSPETTLDAFRRAVG